MVDSRRAFVLRQTRLRDVPDLDGLRLHLTDDIRTTWHAAQLETGDGDAPLPYWSVAWGGGLALARYLRDHPEVAVGRRVVDVGAGSGIVAIAAALAGAADVVATDIDPYAVSAIGLNARANRVRVAARRSDAFDDDPPPADLVLAGDTWYDAEVARRGLAWLRRVRDAGIEVLVGDPGRAHLPADALIELASYEVRTTSDLEDLALRRAAVYRLA